MQIQIERKSTKIKTYQTNLAIILAKLQSIITWVICPGKCRLMLIQIEKGSNNKKLPILKK